MSKKIVGAIALAFALSSSVAIAQTNPGLTQGQKLTPAQWNNLFASKQDTLGYVPMNSAGGVFSGRVVTAAPGASTAGFNLIPGTAPGSPANGDLWATSSSLFARINGATYDLIGATAVSMTVGTTTVLSGTNKGLLYNNAGVLGNLTTVNNGVLVTNGSGTPSISTTLPNGLALGSPASIGTLPAFTLGGTISGGGNQINNVIIGSTGPLAGSFTTLGYSATLTGTSTSSACAAIGRQGATAPAFQVDCATASQATGIKITGAAAGAGVAVAAISSGTNENLGIDAKGSGTVTLGGVSTGGIVLARPTTFGVAGSLNGSAIFANTTSGGVTVAPPAGALGSVTNTLQAATDTFVYRATTDTLTNKRLTASSNVLGGVTMTLGSDATGDIYYRNSGGQLTRLPAGINGQVLQMNSGLPSWQAGSSAGSVTIGSTAIASGANGNLLYNNAGTLGETTPGDGVSISGGTLGLTAARRTLPTISIVTTSSHSGGFSANGSGTYTTPANVLWIELELVGGGSGGNGYSAAGAATATCWNTSGSACTSPVLSAGGGNSSAGGTISGSGSCNVLSVAGANGNGGVSTTASTSSAGGSGGASILGGAGAGVTGTTGGAAIADTGSGGAGGGVSAATSNTANGGGAGAGCRTIITSPAGSYTYTVGTKSNGGAGGGIAAGGNGADGRITIIEHYGS